MSLDVFCMVHVGVFLQTELKKKKEKKNEIKWGKERGERAAKRGARCGLPASPGGLQPVISWGHAAEDAGEEPSPSHPARDICQGLGCYTLIRPRQ